MTIPGTISRECRPLEILYCITDTDPGGAERFLLRLLRHLPPKRVRPHVVSLLPEGTIAAELRQLRVPVTSLHVSRASAPLALHRLRRILHSRRWDLVHSILVHANLLARLANLPRSCPLVSSVRVAERGKFWQLRAEQLTWRLSDAIVAVSQGVADFLRRVGVSGERIRVIPNSVAVDEIRSARPLDPLALGLPKDGQIVLFVGRLHRQKGADVLLKAFADLHRQVPDAVLVVAGDGPERNTLQKLASALGLSDRIYWIGHVPNVPNLMKAARVLALPSRWEGMPNVALEAMAAGLPVVGTRVEGVTELLSGNRGLLVPPDDPSHLARALLRLLVDESLREAVRTAAAAYVESFSPSKEAEQYLQLYHELLAGRRRGASC